MTKTLIAAFLALHIVTRPVLAVEKQKGWRTVR